MLDKKADIKIQEMAFVLVAVAILFSLLFVLFARFQSAQLLQNTQELRKEHAISALRVIASMPELRCSASFSGVAESACIDVDKLGAFEQQRENYREFWQQAKFSSLTVEEVYPSTKEYVLKQGQEENTVTYSTYIPLCKERTSSIVYCKIARINVEVIQ